LLAYSFTVDVISHIIGEIVIQSKNAICKHWICVPIFRKLKMLTQIRLLGDTPKTPKRCSTISLIVREITLRGMMKICTMKKKVV